MRHFRTERPLGTAISDGQGGAAECAQIEIHSLVVCHADCRSDTPRGFEFPDMALAVGKGEGIDLEALTPRNCQDRGRISPPLRSTTAARFMSTALLTNLYLAVR